MEQRSDDWFAARLGKVTASRIADVMAKTKTGYSATRKNYMTDLVVERLTGAKDDSYVSPAMQWGIDTEPLARAAYENRRDVFVIETGFHDHPEINYSGASPDGLIGEDGLIEIKCPNKATHMEYLLSGEVPQKYILQMQWQMECTQRTWCDFVSYHPTFPERHQLMIVRVQRDEELLKEIRKEVLAFLAEVEETIYQLDSKELA